MCEFVPCLARVFVVEYRTMSASHTDDGYRRANVKTPPARRAFRLFAWIAVGALITAGALDVVRRPPSFGLLATCAAIGILATIIDQIEEFREYGVASIVLVAGALLAKDVFRTADGGTVDALPILALVSAARLLCGAIASGFVRCSRSMQ